ncbi:hypothetical protein EPN90_01135 [Patescibacteria group bacterium]|nr:MAG: hypothetical protein EPN90_01135 [Patescibacteria group bacterium]
MKTALGRQICVAAVFLGAVFFAFNPRAATAGANDTWRGALWSSTAGWIVMNCLSDSSDPGACAANNYGVDVADAPNAKGNFDISGWAWSANIGWVCFGATCDPGTVGPTPEGGASYAELNLTTNQTHGWANIVALGPKGWLSLNCGDLAPGCSSYFVSADLASGVVNGFGWNGNFDGTGIGWVDFSPSSLLATETLCADGFDNDNDGPRDCADSDCTGKQGPACAVPYVCGAETKDTCQYKCDADGNLQKGCADPACKAFPDICPSKELICDDLIDNDNDGPIDCADPDCYGVGTCAADEGYLATCQPANADGGGVPGAGGCCANVKDDDAKNSYDCQDPSCASVCTGICAVDNSLKCIYDWQCPPDKNGIKKCKPQYFPWLQSLLSDIYSKGKIEAAKPPPGPPAVTPQRYNATFCLLSSVGTVTNFYADPSGMCASAPEPLAVNAPAAATGYSTSLGRIDLAGILAGRYGPTVANVTLSSGSLDGKVYVFDGDLAINAPLTFNSAGGSSSGGGLIVVRGNLNINADVAYESSATVTKLKNLASVGWLVLRRPDGTGGRITLSGDVTKIAGAFFAETSFRTGPSANSLTVFGPVIAKDFVFDRTFIDPSRGSEQVVYDARTILNPPPGLADFAKALPTISLGTP